MTAVVVHDGLYGSVAPGAVRELIADLARPRPGRYWRDLAGSAVAGWLGVVVALSDAVVPLRLVAGVVAAVALYRAALFIHEIAHGMTDDIRGFEAVWNAFVGIPLLVPAMVYEDHAEHHAARTFGTERDGEYTGLAGRPGAALLLVGGAAIAPALLLVRYAVLAPLGWVLPPVRRFAFARATSLAIDLDYRRVVFATWRRGWIVQEVAAALWAWLVVTAILTGWLDAVQLATLWCIVVGALALNLVRVLGAHDYLRTDGATFEEQVLDSTNHTGRWCALVWAPVGLQWHATHHLFPTMPYHSLRAVSERLAATLPIDAAFHQTYRPSLRRTIRALIRSEDARSRSGEQP